MASWTLYFINNAKKGMALGIEKGIETGIAKGMATGERKKALLIARQLLAMNLDKDKIAQITGLELTELDNLV